MFTAVLDTCVLWPSLQRDFLLSLAVETLYRPLWSEPILDELEYHEAAKLVGRGTDPATAEKRATRLVEQMRSAFEDALVENWEPHEGTFGLPDPDDEHVVAAALVGGAGAIVTENIKDFPRAKVPQHMLILEPAAFAADTVATNPDAAVHALATISARFRNPPQSVDDLLTILEQRYSMTEAVDLMRSV
ncbi:PIN domain-containing protein [Nocardia uniformis]|uniref:PIN domain-containing protein n=1 Tax=Nocardia uniformis TaxID=53432 RepID=A0A849CIC6_9NOCA|nr:PIN domain-containing protein [Nocardia uniformis]NNH76019.1 PIN domain-containing protein [Nocardia uniformis]